MAEKTKRLLLVEDEALIALAEKASLERQGYSVVVAASGISAVAITYAESDIDLVLMDINLGPGMDGTAAAEAILKRREMPVVFLSSHIEPEIVEKTERITSYGYVVKNSGITVLDASIKMAFKLFEANRKLKATMGRLEATLDAMPDLLFEVGLDGRYYDVHAPQTELLFKPPPDMIGKSVYEILPPEPAEIIMGAVREAHEKGRSFGRQYQLTVPAGKRWFEISVSRIVSASDEPRFIFLVRNITERKGVEEALRREGYLLQVLMNSSLVHIYFKDLESRFILATRSHDAFFGLSDPAQMIGKTDFDFFTSEHAQAAYDDEQTIIRTGRPLRKEERETWAGRPDTWVLTEKMPLYDTDGNIIGTFGISSDITERKHAEEALRESEARYRSLFQNAPVGIFYSTVDGMELSVNDEYARIMGYDSPEELVRIVNRAGAAKAIFDHPEERAYLIATALESPGRWIRTEQRYKRKDGTHILTRLVFRALSENPGMLEGFVEDLSERRKAEASRHSSEERLRNVIAAANIGTWEWNVQTDAVKIDERSLALLGYEPGELPHLDMKAWLGLKHPDDAVAVNDLLKDHLQGKTDFYSFESRMRHKSGGWVWILGRGKLVAWDRHDAPLRMYGIYMDITERRKAEEQVRSLLREKDTILREVHHRIKNNMGVIHSLLGLQAASVREPSAAAALDDAANRVQSMTLLYDKLYQSATFDAVSIRDYLSSLVDEIVGTFPGGASVRVEKNIEDVQLDVKRLQPLGIIVNELLTNIMKHAFAGRDAGSIEVSVSVAAGKVSLAVRDDGVGMPDAVDLGRSSGFGLTLVQTLTEQIGGRLRIERGRGTAVILEFEK
ncbi:MAG: PAS domain S-box protein [Treponema sp.]|nr:PAS domain S-box protein [Treponema sp.]